MLYCIISTWTDLLARLHTVSSTPQSPIVRMCLLGYTYQNTVNSTHRDAHGCAKQNLGSAKHWVLPDSDLFAVGLDGFFWFRVFYTLNIAFMGIIQEILVWLSVFLYSFHSFFWYYLPIFAYIQNTRNTKICLATSKPIDCYP